MATSKGQRVGAFLLASLFLLTTVGSAAYVIYEINKDESGIIESTTPAAEEVEETEEEKTVDPTTAPGQQLANFTPPEEVNELRFDEVAVGSGAAVSPGATVTIHYTGALAADGVIFDSSVSRGEPAKFSLDSLIAGWQEAIPGMNVGGKRRLYIPSDKGYGESGSSGIPPNSDLIFDIELFATE